MHYKTTRIKCQACVLSNQKDAMFCHECNGKRYIELRGVLCEGEEIGDPMTGGWECLTCGQGGP